MLNLPTTSSEIMVVTGSGVSSIAVHASFIDVTAGSNNTVPGALNTLITTATSTVVVPSPAPTVDRNVKFLSLQNTSNVSCLVTVLHTDGVSLIPLLPPLTLLSGYTLQYDTDGNSFVLYDTSGRRLQAVN